MRIFKKREEAFQKPILVFTSNGWAVPLSIRIDSILAVIQPGKQANVMGHV